MRVTMSEAKSLMGRIKDSRTFPDETSRGARWRGVDERRPLSGDEERARRTRAMDRFERSLARQKPIPMTLREMLAARREGLL